MDTNMDISIQNTPRIIRMLRHHTGLTQEELAHELKVTVSTVNRWENGHTYPSKLAFTLINLYASTVGYSIDQPSAAAA